MNVLFVCTGNMCRSPMAEHMLKKMLHDAKNKMVHVKSAGVEPSTWMEMPAEVKKVLEKEGVTVTKHAAQGLTPALIKESDLILVMEEYHRSVVTHRFPAAASKVQLLKDHGISDPYGHPMAAYARAMKDIKESLSELLKKIGAHRVRKD